MRRFNWFALALLTFPLVAQAQNAWINEFHYDNTGSDTGEFVEVVIQDITTNPASGFDITLYNGSVGASYNTTNVGGCTVGGSVGDYVFYTCAISGIQNGPDGIALSGTGGLIAGQFLSYEGSFAATNGPANGVSSTDIGVSEPGTTPVGESLQLTGTGRCTPILPGRARVTTRRAPRTAARRLQSAAVVTHLSSSLRHQAQRTKVMDP